MPYTLTFEVETTRLMRPVLIEGRADGQLQGVGVWRLQHHSDVRGDQSRVVWPIREARQCARAVDEFLMGGRIWRGRGVEGRR